MGIGAVFFGVIVGIVSFVTTLVMDGGFLWALAAYMAIGTLATIGVIALNLAAQHLTAHGAPSKTAMRHVREH